MPLSLPEPQLDRIRSLMATGGFADEAAVVSAALDLLERRQKFRGMVQEGIDAADRGELLDHETVFREVRQRIAAVAVEREQQGHAKKVAVE